MQLAVSPLDGAARAPCPVLCCYTSGLSLIATLLSLSQGCCCPVSACEHGCCYGQQQGGAGGPSPGREVAEVCGAGAHLRRSVLQALVGPVQPATSQQHHCNTRGEMSGKKQRAFSLLIKAERPSVCRGQVRLGDVVWHGQVQSFYEQPSYSFLTSF